MRWPAACVRHAEPPGPRGKVRQSSPRATTAKTPGVVRGIPACVGRREWIPCIPTPWRRAGARSVHRWCADRRTRTTGVAAHCGGHRWPADRARAVGVPGPPTTAGGRAPAPWARVSVALAGPLAVVRLLDLERPWDLRRARGCDPRACRARPCRARAAAQWPSGERSGRWPDDLGGPRRTSQRSGG